MYSLALYPPGLDGTTAAAITQILDPKCWTQRLYRQSSVPWNKLRQNDSVLLLGVVPAQDGDVKRLVQQNPTYCIRPPQEMLEFFPNHIGVDTDENTSISLLLWEHLNPEADCPQLVRWVNDYITWQLNDPNSLPFCTGMIAKDFAPWDHATWKKLLDDDAELIQEIIADGAKIVAERGEFSAALCQDLAFRVEWDGKHFWAMNVKPPNSLIFNSLDPTGIDGFIGFRQMPPSSKDLDEGNKDWCYSVTIYRAPGSNLNCQELAKQFGGNGRVGAAGFTCSPELPFTLEPKSSSGEPQLKERNYTIGDRGSFIEYAPPLVFHDRSTILLVYNSPLLIPQLATSVQRRLGSFIDATQLPHLAFYWTNQGRYRWCMHSSHQHLAPPTAQIVGGEVHWYTDHIDWHNPLMPDQPDLDTLPF